MPSSFVAKKALALVIPYISMCYKAKKLFRNKSEKLFIGLTTKPVSLLHETKQHNYCKCASCKKEASLVCFFGQKSAPCNGTLFPM